MLTLLGAMAILILVATLAGKPKADEQYEQYKIDCDAANKEVTYKPNNWVVSFIIAVIATVVAVFVVGSLAGALTPQ